MRYMKLMVTVFTALLLGTFLQEKGWRGVVPLHSTRKDVETLLGPPKESRGVASTYEFKDGRVRVFYSSGLCKNAAGNIWNVPADTVLSITFHPNAKLMVADLKLDKTKYERVPDYHVQSVVYYFSNEEGVRISSRVEREGEDVQSITYEPAAKDYYLRCPNAPLQPSDAKQQYTGLKFDEYLDLSFEHEKPRLDNLAFYMQRNDQTLIAYMIVYSRRYTSPSEAKARAKRAKDYMIKVRGIQSKRIVTILGGCRDNLEVELFAIPDFMAAPRSTPDCDD